MLKGIGCTATFSALASSISAAVRAAEEQGESAICLSMVYSNAPRAKFDARKYGSQHVPLLKSIYGDSIERIELRTPPRAAARSNSGVSNAPAAAAPMGPPSAVLAATTLWIRDLTAFGEKTAAAGDRISKDLEEVVQNSKPIVQYDKTIVLLGDARSAIEEDCHVHTNYFPAANGGTFDAKYYGEKVVPLMVSLYGKKAIRRIEVGFGQAGQGGAKASLVASAHYYIRDREAWDAAGRQAFPQLMAEGPKYTTLMPLVANLEVTAIG